ncbi:MAG: RIP metalloprotease RseP [bacterium]|nr:RIP metalloprotease RseP [bacterium]
MVWTILLFLALLSLLVFVHELGHFWMARRMGMKVEEFGFGFPPRMFGIRRKGTLYSINWIPLGGFVRIKGESGSNSEDPDSFASKSAWSRFLVLVAGVTMNLVLAAVLLGAGFMIGLPSVVSDDLPASAHVSDEAIRIVQVLPDSTADLAGLKMGDVVVSINDKTLTTTEDVYTEIGSASGEMDILLRRGEDFVTARVARGEIAGVENEVLGVVLVRTGFISYGFFESILRGVTATVDLTYQVVRAFVDLIGNLISRDRVAVDLSGPVGIAVMTGEVAELGISYLLQFAALLSINLAVINILPFPALDGGRVLFLIIEKMRRKKVSETVEAVTHNLGFLLLISVVILVTYRDIVRFGDEIFGAIKSVF